MVRFNIFQAFGNIVVWGLIAPSLDILIYSEPASKVFTHVICCKFTMLKIHFTTSEAKNNTNNS
jgi:uncharacterized membrane protein